MADKEALPDKISKVVSSIGNVLEAIIDHADGEVRKLKKKIIHFSVIAGTLVLSLMFILIGIAKLLPDLTGLSEGVSFMIVGCVMVVLVSFISLFWKI